MVYLEIAIIGLQTVVLTIIMIFFFRGLSRTLLESFIALDKQISEAIKTLIEGEINLPDPPNPLQQILMEVVMKNLQKDEPNIELVRGQDGKFK
tara:strand:- start:244 stop:525 length:282 start_codon:yes stop_codon:yes gene_type:complete